MHVRLHIKITLCVGTHAVQVVSSLQAAIGPEDAVMFPSSLPQDSPFYQWLQGIQSKIWTDPMCGNGLCEPPFEYPAYETSSVLLGDPYSLGCQVDCGRETDVKEIIVLITVRSYLCLAMKHGRAGSSEHIIYLSLNVQSTRPGHASASIASTAIGRRTSLRLRRH
eukprot:9503998-Pyramimonas_sp.AAC.2